MDLIALYGLACIAVFIKGIYECKTKQNAYGDTIWLSPLGIFVWGDTIAIGFFWIAAAAISYLTGDAVLFGLIWALFWVIRSAGETIYWFNQQFSKIIRNPSEKMRWYFLFKNDSIWFFYQTAWQCLTVVFLIAAIYFGALWVGL